MSVVKWNDTCDHYDTCALAGAASFAAGIPGSHILVNGPLWCFFYAKGHMKRINPVIMDRMTGSQPENDAVIFGSERFLVKEIERLLEEEQLNPSLLFVENSCAFTLIGDDNAGILKSLELPFPAVSLDCGGLLGGFAEGYVKAAELIINSQVKEKYKSEDLKVNLLGATEFYLNGKADIKEMVHLLEMAGYIVNCVPGGGSSLESIKALSRASLNIVVHEELGLKTAKLLENKFGIPYVLAGVPYGLEGTLTWLRRINKVLPAPSLETIEAQVKETRELLEGIIEDFSCYWGNMWYDQVIIQAPGTQALCLAQALREEWFNMGKLTVLCLQPVLDNIYCDVADEIYTKNVDFENWENYVETQGEGLFIGSSNEAANLLRKDYKNIVTLNVAYPIHDELFLNDTPYVGIQGTKNLLQKLWNLYMQGILNGKLRQGK